MSASDSNLNSVGYDMVVGLTQNSINKTMKTYLEPMDAPLGPIIYVYTDGSLSETRMLTPEETDQLLAQADPFSIPDGTTSDSDDATAVAAGKILYDALFYMGFKATMGLPIDPNLGRQEYFDALAALPNIITLDTAVSAQTVDYNLYYKDFQIVQQVGGRGTYWSYQNLEQTPAAPWIFKYQVNLDLSTQNVEYSEMSDEQKESFDSLKNLDPNTMFGISQLMLDLTTPLITGSVEISGMDPSDPSYDDIQDLLKEFSVTYWDALRESGDIVFTTSMTPILENGTSTTLPPSTLAPGDLNFIVKPYANQENLSPQESQDLNTLNYLINQKVIQNGSEVPNPLPYPLTNISWDWLNQAEDIDYDGIMSVRRDVFIDHLYSILNPLLKNICLDPSPQIHGPDNVFADSRNYYACNYSPSDSPATFQIGTTVTPKVLWTNQWTSGPETQKDSGYGEMTCINYANATISIQDNQIICECEIISYIEIDIYHFAHLGHNNIDGYVYASKCTNVMPLAISPTGQIAVGSDASITTIDMVDNPDYSYSSGQLDDPSWSDDVASKGLADCTIQMRADCGTALDDAMASFQENIVELISGINGWVFPGGTTFTFSNCAFSDAQDFLSMITYSDPT